jgi:transposase
MTKDREILRLASLRINHTQIAASVGCTRQTVISVLRKAEQRGIGHENAVKMSDRDLAAAIINESAQARAQYRMPDYKYVHKELAKDGVTLSLLWIEYCEECRKTRDIPYQSTQFNKYYGEYVRKTGATMHIERKPGESMEVDWAGGSYPVWDAAMGESTDVYVFVSALSYSGYAYAEAFWSMKSEDWIQAHVNAYEYYGGVTRILIPDNLRTGVDKNTPLETVINKTYREMAEHYGTAVLPARVDSPNNKPHAEGAVKGIKTWILAALRHERFYALADLNNAIRLKLEEYNRIPFQKIEGSRESKYREEKLFLLPLPRCPFELAEWKVATVQKDYHVKYGYQYFSVPHDFIGKKVDIRATRHTIEVFYENMRICSHRRADGFRDKYITEPSHMPDNHRKYGEWNGERFRSRAHKIGPHTLACVEHFLSSAKVEEQSYKTCNALLHLSDRHTAERLEKACGYVLSFTPRPSYKAVDGVLRSGQDLADKEVKKQEEDILKHGFIRGAKYYGGDDDAE